MPYFSSVEEYCDHTSEFIWEAFFFSASVSVRFIDFIFWSSRSSCLV